MSPLEVLQFIGYSTGVLLHLWMGALLLKRRRGLSKMERVLLALAIGMGVWPAYALAYVAVTDILIACLSSSLNERRSLQTLAASLVAIGALILAVYVFGVGEGTRMGFYLKTLANLGSLLPSALIAY